MTPPRILSIAGSDPSGGAGIQADLKTIAALGGYGMAAITALTAQNTLGVAGVHAVPAEFVAQQVRLCLEDIGADAIKTGMLFSAEIVEVVARTCRSDTPLILDPVMVAKGGAPLLKPDAIDAVKTLLIPHAHVITPNIPEAELLCGMEIRGEAHMQRAGEKLLTMGAHAVLIKGGHLPGNDVIDMLVMQDGTHTFRSQRIATRHTHGTGCTLASAIATRIGAKDNLLQAITTARVYVYAAIQTAPGFGKGHGPLWHGVTTPPISE